jgi:hypothetical protein
MGAIVSFQQLDAWNSSFVQLEGAYDEFSARRW